MGRIGRIARRLRQFIAAGIATHAIAVLALDVPAADTPVIQEVFQRVTPSVVSIRARSRDVMPGTQTRFTEVGSGVLICGDGQVLTAAHLVYAMDDISVVFPTGETVSAKVKASDSVALELSLLQLDRVPQGATVSPMADSNPVRAGDPAFIVGASYRVRHTLAVGSIKAHRSPATLTMPLVEFFLSDAVTDVISSGAPMFNLKGEVIAIVSQNMSSDHARKLPDFVVTLNTAGCRYSRSDRPLASLVTNALCCCGRKQGSLQPGA
jgi:serine protease Do